LFITSELKRSSSFPKKWKIWWKLVCPNFHIVTKINNIKAYRLFIKFLKYIFFDILLLLLILLFFYYKIKSNIHKYATVYIVLNIHMHRGMGDWLFNVVFLDDDSLTFRTPVDRTRREKHEYFTLNVAVCSLDDVNIGSMNAITI